MIKEWMAKQQAKGFLQRVFKQGDIGISYSYGNNQGMIYPKIRNIKFDYKNKTAIYYFSLPTGLDPKEIKKKEYCFKQVFGDRIEIEGEVKEFKLTVRTVSMPKEVAYNYEQYVEQLKKHRLPIVCGISVNNELITYDMVKNPHLLIAGETGSGKSTQLRSVLTTLIRVLPPERLILYLCDLKRSEFHLFRHIEHVRGPFNSVHEIKPQLKKLQAIMKNRGDLLDAHEVAHIDDLPSPPPYIVLVIDEVALLQKENDLMSLVEEISAIGRALGVFLILSMQRPDAKVLDGKLKNNLTVRMGFKCADLINSRIIGTPGSEKLKDEGRMLMKLPKYSELIEIQAPYLKLTEAQKTLEPYKSIKGTSAKKEPFGTSEIAFEMTETDKNIFEVLDE